MLDIKKVTGSEPVRYEKLRGGTLVNVLAKEVQIEDGTQWEYWQTFTTEVNAERLDLIASSVEAEIAAEAKAEALSNMTVEVGGKIFYADAESRVDVQAAIANAGKLGQTSTLWKLAEEFEGSRVVNVTLEELEEVSRLALVTKGEIVGAL